jgi:voltage-gated potassium channel
VLPISSSFRLGAAATLVGGLAFVGLTLTWQVRSILVAEAPAAQAVGALVVSVALFLVVFSAIYFTTGMVEASSWSEPMTRMDALYYTVSVFTTVGFGDITALSQTTRALTAVQMVAGFLLVAVIARVVVGAVQVNLRRRETGGSG